MKSSNPIYDDIKIAHAFLEASNNLFTYETDKSDLALELLSLAQYKLSKLYIRNTSSPGIISGAPASTPLGPFFYPTVSTLGDRIKSMRELRNLGQFYLASSIGVTRSCIEAWEENTTIPGCDRLMPLANALNCDPLWLLTGEESGGAQ